MPAYNPGPLFRRGNRTFGRRRHPITGAMTGHAGDDWPADSGTPIPAAAGGRVIENRHQYNAASGTGWGWFLLIEHEINGQTVSTRYAHMRVQSPISIGQTVVQGQTIGEVGSTGGSTGPHLHFEVIVDGTPVDPATFDFPVEVQADNTSGDWSYPFPAKERDSDKGLPELYYEALSGAESGFYPIGLSGIWHGGVHFDRNTGAHLDQEKGVHSLTAGEVLAYRVDSKYPVTGYSTGEAEYSSGFVLVRHKLQLPPPPEDKAGSEGTVGEPHSAAADDESKADDESLTFFSLYMHLARVDDYPEDKPRPGYWSAPDSSFSVGSKAVDRNPYNPQDKRRGIRVRRGSSSSTPVIGWLPPGVRLSTSGTGNWRKIESYEEGGPAIDPVNTPSEDAPQGWIYTPELTKVDIREPATTDSVHILEEPVSVASGEFLGHLGQYRRRRDAGPFCSHRPLLHLEVFAGDELKEFLRRSRERDRELPDAAKDLLYVKRGAKLALPLEPDRPVLANEVLILDAGDEEAEWIQATIGSVSVIPRSALGAYSGDATRTYDGSKHLLRILDRSGGAITLEAFNALDSTGRAGYPDREVASPTATKVWIKRADLSGARVEHGRTLNAWSRFPLDPSADNGPTAGFPRVARITGLPETLTDDEGKRWWEVEVGLEGGGSATAWARETGQANVELCSCWAWPGFEIVNERGSNADHYRHSLQVNKETTSAEDFEATADAVEKSELFQRLRDALDVDKRDGVTREEMRAGLRRPWLSQAISHLIASYETEWGGDMSKWTALDELMDGEYADDWKAEKDRIKQLMWWEEASGLEGFPESTRVHCIHPVALVKNFHGTTSNSCFPLKEAQEIALRVSGGYEGRSNLDYHALADDFDGQGTSFGLIQWNFGQNTLGPLLLQMYNRDPTAFAAAFPVGSDYQTLETALRNQNQQAQLTWARDLLRTNRTAWSQAFNNLGDIPAFQEIQLGAVLDYHENVVKAITLMRGIAPDLMQEVHVGTYAALYDLSVQQGTIDKSGSLAAARKRYGDERPSTQAKFLEIIVQERARTANSRWRADAMSRRMGIIQREPYSASESGYSAKRSNANFKLLEDVHDKSICQL